MLPWGTSCLSFLSACWAFSHILPWLQRWVCLSSMAYLSTTVVTSSLHISNVLFYFVFKMFSLNLPTSGRNLHLPSHRLLRLHQSVSEFYDYFWMSCYWLDFWWARLLLLKKANKPIIQFMFLYSCYGQHNLSSCIKPGPQMFST